MLNRTKIIVLGVIAVAAVFAVVKLTGKPAGQSPPDRQVKAALTVEQVQPQISSLPLKVSANGNVAAWQEASIGSEAGGLQLSEVLVNVGDEVVSGQVLAVFADDRAQADLAQAKADEALAEATLAEASANAQRARNLQPTGVMSAQQITQYLTAERTAQARLEAQRAHVQAQQIRLRYTEVKAPDHGVISARSATVGAVPSAGQELFRMIRQGRLEWRAEVSSADLAYIKPGMRVTVMTANGPPISGVVRKVAPTVDAQTRNGVVYVDLPSPGSLRAGMFARGEFETGSTRGLTLPQSAVLIRDGFSYVMRIGADSKVAETKISTGRRAGDYIEIISGIDATMQVVASGGAFLADGDTVRVTAMQAAGADAGKPAAMPNAASAH